MSEKSKRKQAVSARYALNMLKVLHRENGKLDENYMWLLKRLIDADMESEYVDWVEQRHYQTAVLRALERIEQRLVMIAHPSAVKTSSNNGKKSSGWKDRYEQQN